MSFIKFIKGTAFAVINGKRVPTDSLEESLDTLAENKCQGLSICKGVLWLKDQTTGNPVQFMVDNGAIKVKDKDGEVIYDSSAE